MFRRIGLITFQIQPQSRTLGAGTGQTENYTRAIGEANADALLLADAAIYRVGVAEVIGVLHLIATKLLAGQGRQHTAQAFD